MVQESGFPSPHKIYPIGWQKDPQKAIRAVLDQSLSYVHSFPPSGLQASLFFTVSWSLLRLMSTEMTMPSKPLIFCHPFLLLPSISPSIRVYSSEMAVRIRWPKYWSFSFSISPSSEYSGLISLGLTGLISLLSKGLSGVFFSTTVQKHQFLGA